MVSAIDTEKLNESQGRDARATTHTFGIVNGPEICRTRFIVTPSECVVNAEPVFVLGRGTPAC